MWDKSTTVSTCLEIFVQDRADPVFIPGNRHLTVIRRNCRGYAAKIGQRIIVYPDPVPDIAFRHVFGIKVITVGKGSDKDGDLCGLFRISAVMQIELLSGVVQLEIDAEITLDVEGQLFGIGPFAITPAVLAIAHWLLSVYNTYGIVFLPQMLQGFPFAGQSLVDSFLIKIPVEELIRQYTWLFIEQAPMYSFVTSACKGYESSRFSLKRFRNSLTVVLLQSPQLSAI